MVLRGRLKYILVPAAILALLAIGLLSYVTFQKFAYGANLARMMERHSEENFDRMQEVFKRGENLYMAKDYKKAANLFQQAVDSFPTKKGCVYLADSYIHSDEPDKAEKAASAGLELPMIDSRDRQFHELLESQYKYLMLLKGVIPSKPQKLQAI